MVLVSRTSATMTIQDANGCELHTILHVMEFDSVRMRSSVLIKHANGRIVLYSKGTLCSPILYSVLTSNTGADSVLLPRCQNLAPPSSDGSIVTPAQILMAQASADIEAFCAIGLRTLAVAQRELTPLEYERASWLLGQVLLPHVTFI